MSLSLPIIGYKMSGGSCGSANTVMYCTSSANGCFTTRASTCCGCGASYCYGCPSGTSCTTVSSSYYCVKDSVPMWTPPPVYIYHPYSPTPYYTGTPYSSGAPSTKVVIGIVFGVIGVICALAYLIIKFGQHMARQRAASAAPAVHAPLLPNSAPINGGGGGYGVPQQPIAPPMAYALPAVPAQPNYGTNGGSAANAYIPTPAFASTTGTPAMMNQPYYVSSQPNAMPQPAYAAAPQFPAPIAAPSNVVPPAPQMTSPHDSQQVPLDNDNSLGAGSVRIIHKPQEEHHWLGYEE